MIRYPSSPEFQSIAAWMRIAGHKDPDATARNAITSPAPAVFGTLFVPR
jgi:hypothetical protein